MIRQKRSTIAGALLITLCGVSHAQPTGENTTTAATESAAPPGHLSIVASNLPLRRVISQIEDKTSVTIKLRSRLEDHKIDAIFPQPVPVERVLQNLVNSKPDLRLEQSKTDPTAYELWKKSDYDKAHTEVRYYSLTHQQPDSVAEMVTALKVAPSDVIIPNRASAQVVVRASADNHETYKEMIGRLDQAQYTRVFSLQHRRPSELKELMAPYLRQCAVNVLADDATGQLMVQSGIATLQKIEQVVKTLDIEVPSERAQGA